MNELIENIDWMTLLTTIWTVVMIPIGKQIFEWAKSKKSDKYITILYDEVKKAVKSVYETEVKDIKGTSEWTEEKKNEVKELAKQKTIHALSSIAYKYSRTAGEDFGVYLDSLIGTALYDVKHEKNYQLLGETNEQKY